MAVRIINICEHLKTGLMRRNLLLKTNIFFGATFLAIAIFVLLLIIGGNDLYWYGLLIVLIALQLRFKISISSLFPIIAILTLTEYYFLFSGKRAYLCELVYIPLMFNYIVTDLLPKPLSKTKLTILALVLIIILFQGLNFLVNSDFSSSFFRVRTLAFPLFLIAMVDSQIKNKGDLKRAVKMILFISLIATIIVYLQFLTGEYYILQNSLDTTQDESNFVDWYLNYTQDSFLFNLLGLHIKGPMPPVGLNYFKFGYSEKIIVPAAIFFSLFRFQSYGRRYTYLLLFFFLGFATILTGSRSVLLTYLFIVLIVYLFYKKRLKWNFILLIILSFFGVTYLLGPLLSFINLEEFGTLADRIFYMEDFFKFIQNHPQALVAGSSPEHYLNLTKSAQPPHHFFAFGVVYDGIIVTTIVFFMLYKLLKRTRNINTEDKELLGVGYGLWASLFGFVFIYGQTSYLTWSVPHNMFFCIIIGLLIATYRISKIQFSNIDLKHPGLIDG